MGSSDSLIGKLEDVAAPLVKFDAFPKIPKAYKARSESRGFLTVFIALAAFFLLLGDVAEYIWGWADYEFSVDSDPNPYLSINLDMAINMPCKYLSVDLRDAVGDRLFLSGSVRRDGVLFDIGKATTLKEHAQALSARQAISQSRKSRGFFSWFQRAPTEFAPSYEHEVGNDACRIYGHMIVKKVTANLHITTLGHGYTSYEHVPHEAMNLSHVITEFSFGPFFPDITQPLDSSLEIAHEPFSAYQYFLHVVPTTYIAPRSHPLRTHQYSVTHYTRILEHGRGTPGIFFKFDLDPISITIYNRTTTFIQLIIRCVGVIGGIFVCVGYAIRITTRAVEVVSGTDTSHGIVAAEASGAKVGLRAKWGGNELRPRPKSRLIPQGTGWTVDGAGNTGGSPYSSYAGTPVSGAFPASPYLGSPVMGAGNTLSAPPTPNMGIGIPLTPGIPGTPGFGPPTGPPMTPRSPSLGFGPPLRSASGGGAVSAYGVPPPTAISQPGTPAYGQFPLPGSPGPLPHLQLNGGANVTAYGSGSVPGSPRLGSPTLGPPPARKAHSGKKDD